MKHTQKETCKLCGAPILVKRSNYKKTYFNLDETLHYCKGPPVKVMRRHEIDLKALARYEARANDPNCK